MTKVKPYKYTRKERRKLTLAKAKKVAKEGGLPRRTVFKIQAGLMRTFPKGTLDKAPVMVVPN